MNGKIQNSYMTPVIQTRSGLILVGLPMEQKLQELRSHGHRDGIADHLVTLVTGMAALPFWAGLVAMLQVHVFGQSEMPWKSQEVQDLLSHKTSQQNHRGTKLVAGGTGWIKRQKVVVYDLRIFKDIYSHDFRMLKDITGMTAIYNLDYQLSQTDCPSYGHEPLCFFCFVSSYLSDDSNCDSWSKPASPKFFWGVDQVFWKIRLERSRRTNYVQGCAGYAFESQVHSSRTSLPRSYFIKKTFHWL